MTIPVHPVFRDLIDSMCPGVRREAAPALDGETHCVEEPSESVRCPRHGRKELNGETDTYWCPECVALGLERKP